MVDRSHYNCVLSQEFSPCGNYLLCGNNYGVIAVYNVGDCQGKSERRKGPDHSFTTPNHEQVCSMAATSQFLVTGTVGVIYGWDWDSIREHNPRISWKITLPNHEKKSDQDINSLFIRKEENVNQLYAGCGDNTIHVHSLEDGKLIRSLQGHTDYIHSISQFEDQMVSGGEDGSVRLWDLRQRSMTGMIQPGMDSKLARPHFGKWIGDVDINATLLVCGGGPLVGLYDLRSLELQTAVEGIEGGIHITKLRTDDVLIGGNLDHFIRIDTNGQELSRMETSSATVYSAVFREEPYQVLALAGSSQNIDLSTDYTNRHQVLAFFEEII